MSKTKFIPGPYEVKRLGKGEYYVNGEGSHLCLMEWIANYDKEAFATANLFAAAPDLYQQLEESILLMQDAANTISNLSEREGDFPTIICNALAIHAYELRNKIQSASATLAKARNEQASSEIAGT